MFYLDLDELPELARRLRLFGYNRFSWYTFRDDDHLVGPYATAQANVRGWVSGQGAEPPAHLRVLTLARTLGHLFNPVSFYFGFDANGASAGLVAEVGNTFGEQKPYWIGPERLSDGAYRDRQKKYYYISPFMDLDVDLDFDAETPGEHLRIQVDDWRQGERIFTALLSGRRQALTDTRLLAYAARYPLVTLQVIGAIHAHALRLWQMGLPYHRKQERPEWQKGVTRVYGSR